MRIGQRSAPGDRRPRLEPPDVLGARGRARAASRGRPRAGPRARAWTRTLPSAVASTGPASDRQPAGVGGQLAQQRVARAAADEVDDLDRAARTGGPRRGPRGRRPRRGCRGCSGPAPAAVAGAGWSEPAAGGGDPRRHVAGRQERPGRPGRRPGRPAAARPAAMSSAGRSSGVPVELPGPERLLEQPQAHDVAQVADPAVDAALVGEVGQRGSPRSGPGASSSTPTSDHVPQAM